MDRLPQSWCVRQVVCIAYVAWEGAAAVVMRVLGPACDGAAAHRRLAAVARRVQHTPLDGSFEALLPGLPLVSGRSTRTHTLYTGALCLMCVRVRVWTRPQVLEPVPCFVKCGACGRHLWAPCVHYSIVSLHDVLSGLSGTQLVCMDGCVRVHHLMTPLLHAVLPA